MPICLAWAAGEIDVATVRKHCTPGQRSAALKYVWEETDATDREQLLAMVEELVRTEVDPVMGPIRITRQGVFTTGEALGFDWFRNAMGHSGSRERQ